MSPDELDEPNAVRTSRSPAEGVMFGVVALPALDTAKVPFEVS
jgi:hypothetical protein